MLRFPANHNTVWQYIIHELIANNCGRFEFYNHGSHRKIGISFWHFHAQSS